MKWREIMGGVSTWNWLSKPPQPSRVIYIFDVYSSRKFTDTAFPKHTWKTKHSTFVSLSFELILFSHFALFLLIFPGIVPNIVVLFDHRAPGTSPRLPALCLHEPSYWCGQEKPAAGPQEQVRECRASPTYYFIWILNNTEYFNNLRC